jgi:hypothetical protein
LAPRKQLEPSVDFTVERHSSIFLLQAHTVAANQWIEDHLPEDRLAFGGAVVVEPRFIGSIVERAMAHELVVR